MSEPVSPTSDDDAPRSRAGTYCGVLAVEALVIVALWIFSRYFSA